MSVFGVDFGNLNSTVAITRYGGVDIVTNEVSRRETTTIVSFLDNERFIGEQGLDRYVRNSQNTVFLLKRFIGMRMDDPQLEQEKRFLTCDIKGDENGRMMFVVNYCGEPHSFYPEQVLAMLLQRFTTYVNEAATVDPRFPALVRDCVLTVPGYYTAEQRRLVYQACEVASLHCMSLVNETTAAAVDYGIFRGSTLSETEEKAQIVGILDIGYGATDFSITKFWRGNCKVLARTFDRNNGTRDIDFELRKYMIEEVKRLYKMDVSTNKRAYLRILQACERLKYLLSANQSAPFNVENVMDIDINIPKFERATLEELSQNVVQRVRAVVERGFAEAGLSAKDFHSIEMIGGGCRIPMFKRLTEDILGRPPSFTLNASETSARGAAIIAAMFSPKFQVREFRVAELTTYPVLLGYHVPNPKNPTSVSFLPDVNKVITLLGAGDSYPKLLDVAVPLAAPLKLYAFYDGANTSVQDVVLPSQLLVGEWEVSGPGGKPQGTIKEVKVRMNVKPDGLVSMESAWAIEVVEAPAETAPQEPAKDEQAKPDGAAAAPAKAEPRPQQKRVTLSFKPNFDVIAHPSELVVEFRKHEANMNSRDKDIISTREKKNELESYILDFRPRIADGGMLAEFVTKPQQEKFIAQCDADENWLYEGGDDATFADYDRRVQALRAIGDPAAARFANLDDVQFAMKGFTAKMEAAKKTAEDKIGKAAHITEEELRAAAATADEAVQWANAELKTLLSAPKTEDGRLTPKDLDAKAQAVTTGIQAVVNRPVPPPPKPAEPKPAEPAPETPKAAEQNANEEEPAAPPKGDNLD